MKMFSAQKVLMLLLLGVLLLPLAPAAAGDYMIGEGDTLTISVWGVEQLNFSVKVRPDGIITVPGLGEVAASGKLPRELQKELTVKLRDLVKNPIVTVTVSEITNCNVYMFGNGIKSGIYNMERKTTLLQLLCSISEMNVADLRRAYLLRNGKKIKENFYNLYMKGDVSEDLQIEPNDALFIPLYQDKFVYVLGAVTTPKAIEFREGMSALEVILEAGDFNKFASKNKTFIVRKVGDTEIVIPIRVKDLLKKADSKQNLKLQPGDYVIAEESIF